MEKKISETDAASFFWSIFDSNILPMFIWDTNGKILEPNDAFLKKMEYSKEDFEEHGMTWKEVPCHGTCHLEEKHVQELRYKKRTAPFMWEFHKKDGSPLKGKVLLAIHKHTDSRGIALVIPPNSKLNKEK